jgi:hypothetical protein
MRQSHVRTNTTARDESTADPAMLVALDAAEAAKHPPHTVLVMSDSRPLAAAAARGYLTQVG